MNKAELVKTVSEKTGLSKADSDKAVEAFIEAVTSAVSSGDKVLLTGFGAFEKRVRPARGGRNPKTGETIEVPETNIVHFKCAKAFKEICNE